MWEDYCGISRMVVSKGSHAAYHMGAEERGCVVQVGPNFAFSVFCGNHIYTEGFRETFDAAEFEIFAVMTRFVNEWEDYVSINPNAKKWR